MLLCVRGTTYGLLDKSLKFLFYVYEHHQFSEDMQAQKLNYLKLIHILY